MADNSSGNWSLIDNDPGVLTELIFKFGVSGIEVEELCSMDTESSDNLTITHGLIFLVKGMEDDELSGELVEDSRLKKIFFAKPVINNACATQAVISILLNCTHPDMNLGNDLSTLKECTMSLDPIMRGLTLSNCQTIREVHNSLASQTLFEFDSETPCKEEDALHFIAYVPIFGRLYELDSWKVGPIDLGPLTPERDWIEDVRPIIKRKINKYNDSAIHFNLMAVVSYRIMIYKRSLQDLFDFTPESRMRTEAVQNEVSRLNYLIEFEMAKHRQYKLEMARRNHN